MKDKVTLYIATHNKTGLKYFGMTAKYFNIEDLQKYYHGSGSYWNKHLKKHGDDITMKIYGVYSLNENEDDYVKPIALKLSEEWNIVKSINETGQRKGKKVWANEIPENGLTGCPAGKAHPMYGKHHTDEAKYKIGQASIGRTFVHSEETKAKLRAICDNHGANNPMYGKHHTEETKEKMRAAVHPSGKDHHFYGKHHTEATKEKISKANSGFQLSDETKAKMSLSHKGKKLSEEHKEKISKANKGKKRTLEQNLAHSQREQNSPRYTCKYCGKIMNKGNYIRWHDKKCKQYVQ